MSKILEVSQLSVVYEQRGKKTPIITDISFSVAKGQCLGILGESGSGKSMTCKAVTGLLDRSFNIKGSAVFHGTELIGLNSHKKRQLRGKDICMVLQNPMNCFDPLYRIGAQMQETLKEHTPLSNPEIMQKSIETLELMHIKSPEDVLKKYPHQLSGGMLQRVMIGLAIALSPKLIIADEPTTAIDSITQFEIIKEFLRIKKDLDVAIIFVTHDLGIMTKLADDVLVMHKGVAVEKGPLKHVFMHSKDVYTQSLIQKRKAVMDQFERVIYG